MHDVVIIGGGPAGLSAALVLGRCRRRVLVFDSGQPRNARSRGVHGYLTRDGILPGDFLDHARAELRAYGIEPRHATVVQIVPAGEAFEVVVEGGERVQTHTVLIASGVRDVLPDIPGLDDCYGISVHHCPYCDGWEVRDKTIAVIGTTSNPPAPLALSLKTWSPNVIACTNGGPAIRAAHRRRLEAQAVIVETRRIDHIEHEQGRVTQLAFADGSTRACEAIFFTAPQAQQCELARAVGCEFTRKGTVKTDLLGKTCIPGIYVAGDASYDVQFVIVAAAEGAKAAVAINTALQARAGLAASDA